jgi:hypothetical protein
MAEDRPHKAFPDGEFTAAELRGGFVLQQTAKCCTRLIWLPQVSGSGAPRYLSSRAVHTV